MTLSFALLGTSETQELPLTTSIFQTPISTSSANLVVFISSIPMATKLVQSVIIISHVVCWSCLLNTSPYLLLSCSIPFPTQQQPDMSIWRCSHLKVKLLTWPTGPSMPGLDFLPSIICVPCSLYASSMAFQVFRCVKHLLTTGPLHMLYPQSEISLPLCFTWLMPFCP